MKKEGETSCDFEITSKIFSEKKELVEIVSLNFLKVLSFRNNFLNFLNVSLKILTRPSLFYVYKLIIC